MSKIGSKFKKGAASFYIVAFSTLILMIIAISFASVIISETTRTSNDDLSQSAYDSALAGIEDAKLAYNNYRNCLNNSEEGNCASIIEAMKNPKKDCDMVGNMLGRVVIKDVGVAIEETTVTNVSNGEKATNNMQQYYTCVTMQDSLSDYRATLSSANLLKVIDVKLDDGVAASQVTKVRLSWYSDVDESNIEVKDSTFRNVSSFPSAGSGTAVPPTVFFGLIQAGPEFNIGSFDTRIGEQTNRGMIYLTPKKGDGESTIGADALLKSNDKAVENKPYQVNCKSTKESGKEFACSVVIGLPEPIGGARSGDSFMFVVGLPYGKPTTDFALELYCGDNCYRRQDLNSDGVVVETATDRVNMRGVQVQVDSTGRANDLYRRVEMRLENMEDYSLSVMGPLELLGGSGKVALKKDITTTCEYNFDPTCSESDWYDDYDYDGEFYATSWDNDPTGVYEIQTALADDMVVGVGSVINLGDYERTNDINLFERNGSSTQKWQIRKNSDGTFTFINPATSKAMDVTGAETVNGTNVWLYTDNGTCAQRWDVMDNGDGTVALRSACSTVSAPMVLDDDHGWTASGTNIFIHEKHDGDNQKWKFVKVG